MLVHGDLNHIRTLQKFRLSWEVSLIQINSILDGVKKEFPNCLTFLNLDESFKKDFDAYIVATPPKSHFLNSKKNH